MILNSYNELNKALQEKKRLLLLICKSGSEQSDCAQKRMQAAAKETKTEVYFVDVSATPDIHTHYGITSAPSLLEFYGGKLINIIKGCQTENYYKSAITGTGFSTTGSNVDKPPKRVTVYTTPTCTWCNTIKTYFKEKNINYTEVNVAANPARAEEMVKKSGQQGVPQTDINGQVVIGFDKNRINELLEIR
jgi:glutaredoxin-like YruB-family protein